MFGIAPKKKPKLTPRQLNKRIDTTVRVFHVTGDGEVFPADTLGERQELIRTLTAGGARQDTKAVALVSRPNGEEIRVDTYSHPIHNGQFYDWLELR